MKIIEILSETATTGSTSSGNIASVVSPHLAIGDKNRRKKYGKGGNPKPPMTVQAKNKDGTAKNALDMPNNIFGAGAVKR